MYIDIHNKCIYATFIHTFSLACNYIDICVYSLYVPVCVCVQNFAFFQVLIA